MRSTNFVKLQPQIATCDLSTNSIQLRFFIFRMWGFFVLFFCFFPWHALSLSKSECHPRHLEILCGTWVATNLCTSVKRRGKVRMVITEMIVFLTCSLPLPCTKGGRTYSSVLTVKWSRNFTSLFLLSNNCPDSGFSLIHLENWGG